MNKEQIFQEIQLMINNQIEGEGFERLEKVIDFLYGGTYEEIYLELSSNSRKEKGEQEK